MDKFFKLSERNTNIKTEFIAGLTIFLAVAYILPVNTFMLAETGMPTGALFLATALSSIIATLIMGLYANFPVVLAPGMGVNAFFTYSVVLYGFGFTWQEGLSIVLISGLLFLIISLTGLRTYIIKAIPNDLRFAVAAGIGFFITFLGLKNAGIVVADSATYVALGDFTQPTVLLAVLTFFLTLILHVRGNKFAIFIGITVSIVVGLILNAAGVEYMPHYENTGSYKDFGQLSETFGVALQHIGSVLSRKEGWIAIFTFLFIDFFDTTGTLLAVGEHANLINEDGELVDGDKALMADSLGTVAGSILGTSTVTSFVESITGIESGGRTGLTAVFTAMFFALAIFLYPLLSVVTGVTVPGYMGAESAILSPITSPALIMVGAIMISNLKNINWDDSAVTIPAFFTVVFMVLSFTISEGIAIGFITYTVIMFATNRRKEIHPIMYALTLLFILRFAIA